VTTKIKIQEKSGQKREKRPKKNESDHSTKDENDTQEEGPRKRVGEKKSKTYCDHYHPNHVLLSVTGR